MKRQLIAVALVAVAGSAWAQGTAGDYRRAYRQRETFRRTPLEGQVGSVRWEGDSTLSYEVQQKDGTWEKRTIAPQGGEVSAAATHAPSHPWGRGGARGAAEPRNTATLQGPQPLRDHWMNVDDERWGTPAVSPDSSLTAFIKNDNVFVRTAQGAERQLTYDGTLGEYYSARLDWSPDGRFLAVNKIRPVAQKRYVYYVESSPTTQLQPILHQQEYAKAGDELQRKTPCVIDVQEGRVAQCPYERIPNPYDVWGPEWLEDSRTVLFTYNERGHKALRVMAMDAETGAVRTVVDETSQTFVNYSRTYQRRLAHDTQMIWMSERDNWCHLYLYDIARGKVIRQITKGEWVVRSVVKVDEEQGVIYFTASGREAGEDPYLIHYYKIGLDGKGLTLLTPGNGNHSAEFNPSMTYLVDTYSRVDEAPHTVLRSVSNPADSIELGRASLAALKDSGWVAPEVFAAPGRDGHTPMWGIIVRPTHFDPSRHYPVVEYIYAGPGDAYTPKSFRQYHWDMQSLAELGFIVVQLDAMGTSYRGKAFEEVCYKNLKDAGFPDREAWIRAAAQKYPYIDASRVGIFGASAGGQESTTAVLLHGDFYKAAYSACGCHDNRMDKIWWNEQWMGYPVDSAYIECSNVENAHRLKGALMLCVGELDDNVDPASTMQVANALIKAGKDFELVVIPGAHHTMGEGYGEHKRFDFFVRNLLGVTPPKWDEVKE